MTANKINPIRGIPVLPNLPTWLAYTQGNIYHVKPYSGSDSNDGLSVDAPLKTLSKAQTLATANQNDIVLLYSEHGSAAYTSDLQSANLAWAKNAVHLIGVNSGSPLSPRSRIGWASDYNAAYNLFTLSASNCYIANILFVEDVAGTSPTGVFKCTGLRNRISNCHFEIAATAHDIASSYCVYLSAAEECLFEDCVIGTPTTLIGASAGAASLIVDSQTCRCIFKNCKFTSSFSHATNAVFVIAAATSINDYLIFEDTPFINCLDRGGTTSLTYAMSVNASAGGTVLLLGPKTGIFGATDWNNDSGNVTAINGSVTANTFGLAVDVTK